MLNFWPIYKRELKTYFQSPSTYVVLALFFLISGMIYQVIMARFSMMSSMAGQQNFFGQMQQAPNATEFIIRGIFEVIVSLFMFTIPMLSMRLLAEEKSTGTFELLVTNPVGDWAILLGKYFALVTVGLVMILMSVIYPFTTLWLSKSTDAMSGGILEWPVIYSCWLGLLLIFATYAAFGVMASAMTENQIAAAIITLIGLILWNVSEAFQMEGYPTLREILHEIAASTHTENFIKGVLTLKDFIYYALASFLFLFIASKTLDARRWRV